MALPSLSKTWQFCVNNIIGPESNVEVQNGNLLIAIVDILTGNTNGGARTWTDSAGAPVIPTGRWTVVESNGDISGPTAGPGHVWMATPAEMDWSSSTPWFWIVLENVDGCQIMLSANGTNAGELYIVFSEAGLFTGGTHTVRPTAADGLTWSTGAAYGGYQSALVTQQVHVLLSTDGRSTRVMITRAGLTSGTWHFERMKNPKASITNPTIFGVIGSTSTSHAITGFGGFLNGASANLWLKFGSLWTRCSYTCEGAADLIGPAATLVQNDFDGNWECYPLGVRGHTVGGRGKCGEVHDVWVPSHGTSEADTFPEDGSRQFIRLGWLLYPWNGSVPIITG